MFKNYMWSHFIMDKVDDGGSGDGAESTNVIDWSKVDWSKVDTTVIPEDVVKKHSAFAKVRDEAANRRKENTQLKKQVEASVSAVVTDEEKPEDKKPDTSNDMPEWAKQVVASVNKITGERVSDWQTQAAKEFGLKGTKIIKNLEGETRDEIFASAKTLADELEIPKPESNANISVGNPVLKRDPTRLAAVKARMRGGRGQNMDIFSPESQRAMGGGVVMDE